MKSAARFFLRVCRQVLKTAWRLAWEEPCAARGPWWTVGLWVAIGACLAIDPKAWLPLIVFYFARWFMGKFKVKNPARPHFRRRR